MTQNKFKDMDKYQKETLKTAVYPKIGRSFVYPILGLIGEAGEVAEKVKKVFRDNRGRLSKEKRMEIVKELGDVMWYVAQIATELEIKLSEVATLNIEKLASRKSRNKLKGSGDDR